MNANKAIVKRFIDDVVNRGDTSAIDSLFAPSFVLHLPGAPPMHGAETIRQTASMFRAAFPDWHDTLETVLAEGDIVVTRWTERGTHRGAFQGLPPTGRSVTLVGMDMFRIVDGKIVEQWVHADMLGLMQQLGGLPTPK